MEIWHLFIVANGETKFGQEGLKLTQRGTNQLKFAGTTIEGILTGTQASREFTGIISSDEINSLGSVETTKSLVTQIKETTITDNWPSIVESTSIQFYKIRIFTSTHLTLQRTKVLIVILPFQWAEELKKLFLNESPKAQGHPLYSTEIKPGDIIEIVYTDELLTDARYHQSP